MPSISTHINENDNYHMVDISKKDSTVRVAKARAVINPGETLLEMLRKNSKTKKGDVFSVSVIAGIMAAKNCSQVIPLCHPLMLSKVEVDYEIKNERVIFESTIKCEGKTGVEMEALMACNIAALTFYDMCKSLNKGIVIEEVSLLSKSGGKSGEYHATK